jgi:hypothetical protein
MGRTLQQVIAWDDERMEAVHDYIQWLFPTVQPSGVNPLAPLITRDTVRAFASDETLRSNLADSLDRMLAFYGFKRDADRIVIDAARFPARAGTWLTPGNHNHLRLTRIMNSLSALGLRDDASALQRCLLEDVCAGPGAGHVTARTKEFWRGAV